LAVMRHRGQSMVGSVTSRRIIRCGNDAPCSPQGCRPAGAPNRVCALRGLVMAAFLVLSTAQYSKHVKPLQWCSPERGVNGIRRQRQSRDIWSPAVSVLVSVADVRHGPPSFSRTVCERKSAAAEFPCTRTCKVGKRVAFTPSRVRIPHPPLV
jgi:hypothetical protein